MNWLCRHYWLQVPQNGWQRGDSDCSPSDRTSGHDSSSSTNIRKETVIHRPIGQQPAPRRGGVSIATNTNTSSVKKKNTTQPLLHARFHCQCRTRALLISVLKVSFPLFNVHSLHIKTAIFLSSYVWRVRFAWQKLSIWSSIQVL